MPKCCSSLLYILLLGLNVLFQSARELLKVGQQGSGTDLASFLLDVYESKGETVNDESRGESRVPSYAQYRYRRPKTLSDDQ